MRKPFVSIGLPVYNGERYLAACLESLTGQEYPSFEIIISDNASTDATPEICERFARADGRIRYVRHARNGGGAWNHNHVVSLAAGEYFKWCGADDHCHPWFLHACVAALEADPAAVLAYPQSVVIDAAGRPLERTRVRLPVDSPDVVTRFTSVMSALCLTQNLHYGVIRRSALARVMPLGLFPAADRCLLGRLTLLGPFAAIPDFLMYRRRHEGNQRSAEE
jgi:cellulose synthase/poly-beta-1,6-N-acetylglucosamine synthase-like glycosyltransferase